MQRKGESVMERPVSPGVEILNFGGTIGDVDTIRLRDIFGQLSIRGEPRIVCNFYEVEDLSLAALGLFIRTRRECALSGGDLVVSQPSPEAEEIFRSYDVLTKIPVYENDSQAVAHF